MPSTQRVLSVIFQLLALLLLSAILPSCHPRIALAPIPIQTFDLPPQHKLVIQLDRASLELVGHDETYLSISGSSSDPDMSITFIPLEDALTSQLQLGAIDQTDAIESVLRVQIPHETQITLIQASGDIYAHDIQAQLFVESISASIRIERLSGFLRAESRRGKVQVIDSHGEIHALAEADEISLSNLRGQITATNIMGNINFSGMITSGDTANFESDHGAVHVKLEPESAAQISITSAGGRIVCTLPGMSGMFESCEGQLGTAGGSLNIRTVSGAVRLDQMP